MGKRWKVGEVARLAHVTVRTLHHYDEIGLLSPSVRTRAGYRLYSEEDLVRLQRILLYRELGFALDAIARVLDDPSLEPRAALRAQHALLLEKRERLDTVVRAVERTLETLERGGEMNAERMFEGFEDLTEAPPEVRAHHAEYAPEASERWGGTEPYVESMRRVKSYSRADWEALRREADQAEARLAALLAEGADPESEAAREGAEALRQHIARWFYPCSLEMHARLADMYEADPRFAAHYEKRATGLAAFVAAAIRANAAGGTS